MRKLDKLIIALLSLIIGFQSYANFRLLESIKTNNDFISKVALLPFEKDDSYDKNALISLADKARNEIYIFPR